MDLDIDSDKDCYIKAADCARQAIVKSGAAPLTELEWYGGKRLFLRPLTHSDKCMDVGRNHE